MGKVNVTKVELAWSNYILHDTGAEVHSWSKSEQERPLAIEL